MFRVDCGIAHFTHIFFLLTELVISGINYVLSCRMTVLEHITISGPHDLIATKFQPDDKGRSGVKYVDLTWTPTQAEKGVNIVCLRAYDDHK